MASQNQMSFESARLYHRIEVQCDLSRTTFAKIKLLTNQSKEDNKLRLMDIKQDLLKDGHKLIDWVKSNELNQFELVAARSYYRNLQASLEHCNGLLAVCEYTQKEIE
jgi:hypothetical protein